MIKLLKAAYTLLFFVPRCIKYIWRGESGRWFIFRDAPDDIVEYFADEFVSSDEDGKKYIVQAREEMQLRAWQRQVKEARDAGL